MIKLFLFNLHFMLLFPRFNVFSYSPKSFLLIESFLAHCLNSDFELAYFLIFKITFTVPFIEIRNKLPEFLLLSFDIDIVSLKVFIFLFTKNYVEFVVQVSDYVVYIGFGPHERVPTFCLIDTPILCTFSLHFLHFFRHKLEFFFFLRLLSCGGT